MTEDCLREIEERVKKATAPPWKATHRDVSVSDDADTDATCGGLLGWEIEGPPEPDRGQFERAADAHFIAASRTDIPALCAEIRRLRAENAELKRCLAVTGDPRNPFGDSPGEETE
jgi:hypothetical protein